MDNKATRRHYGLSVFMLILFFVLVPLEAWAQFPDFVDTDPKHFYILDTNSEKRIINAWLNSKDAITSKDTSDSKNTSKSENTIDRIETTYAYELYKEARRHRKIASDKLKSLRASRFGPGEILNRQIDSIAAICDSIKLSSQPFQVKSNTSGTNRSVQDITSRLQRETGKHKKRLKRQCLIIERGYLAGPDAYILRHNKIADLRVEILTLDTIKEILVKANSIGPKPRGGDNIFPIIRPGQADFFYRDTSHDQISFVSDVILQSNLDQTALESNILSGNLLVFRTDIYTAVSKHADTLGNSGYNNVLYGALVNGKISYPLLFASGDYASFYVPIGLKLSYDNLSSGTEDTKGNDVLFRELFASVYVQLPLTNTSIKKPASFFFNGEYTRVSGNSKFYASLPNIDKPFGIARATAGLEVDKTVRLAVNFPLFVSKSSIPELRVTTVGVQVNPSRLSE
ncbi:hypothetical protein GGR28_003161 [Lewinella aquimaris]|uniref:Uncharacterized protein n=1 Tax=Neolewinella aquimaris TaxID=1835722 RepID=A0A840EAR3_9BACT|nr:hypothetical protein [Neolewinella aquimaris]MBB4080527.1 hypothetical protein [Neolewinella aquimaris]